MQTVETTLEVAIAGTYTVEPVEDALQFWARRFDWLLALRYAPYNQVLQGLLDPGSALGRNRGVNVLFVRWSDLQSAGDRGSRRAVSELAAALRASAERSGTPHMVVLSRSAAPVPAGLTAWEVLDDELIAELEGAANVHVFGNAWIERRYPVASWADAGADAAGRIPYTAEYYAALGTVAARAVHAQTSRPFKVVVLDCDNTLWGGVCGEDGAAGVRLDDAYLKLQRAMAAQAEAGRLICLCSKNAEEDVRGVFAARTDMALPWSRITAHRINWDSKPRNLRALAEELDLGLDSFVFIDDNAVECAAVLAELPEVLTLQLPTDPAAIAEFVDHVWAFDTLQVTSEDRQRGEMYAANARRAEVQRSATSLGDFLDSLAMSVDIAPVDAATVTRAAQLTQRTNQFNAAPAPRTIADIQAAVQRSAICHRVDVRDRFGDYGTVGLMLATTAGSALEVDAFLLSCRALGRGVEHRMLAFLGEAAVSAGLSSVRVRLLTTPRNEPVRRFFGGLEGAAVVNGVAELTAAVACAVRFDPDRAVEADAELAPVAPRATLTAPRRLSALRAIPHELRRAVDVHAAIRADVRRRPELQQSYIEPRAGRERRIAEVWREILHLDRIGAQDRFTDLGGTSLHVLLVHSRLAELGMEVDVTVLFQHPTVRALSEWLNGSRMDGVASARSRALRQRAALVRLARHS